MAETPEGQEKTEQPTGKRSGKARNEGQVARSQELNFVTGLMAALLYFALNGSAMIHDMKFLMHRSFTDILGTELTEISTMYLLKDMVTTLFAILLPFLMTLLIVGILSNIFQFGLLFTTAPLRPKFSKMNPITGVKNLLSFNRLIEVVKSIFKLLIISIIPYIIIKQEVDMLPLIMDMGVWDIMCYTGKICMKILYYVALAFVLLAIIDFIYQKWKFNKDLMMTKEEVKDEFKEAEGDPIVKSKIRSKQIELLRKIMMEQVPKADVVITNPIHLAVALKYEKNSMEAPKVVAKGARLIAERIKQIAREHNVPIIENKPLAQSLYKTVEVGDTIPESLFKAVAEVLAYVYTQKKKAYAA